MTLDNPTLFEKALANKKWIAYGVLVFVGVMLILWLVAYQDACSSRRDINRQKAEVEAKQAEIDAAKQELNNLLLERAKLEQKIEHLKLEKAKAEKEYIDAQNQTNSSLDAVNAIRNADYNGTSYDAANAARCRAYPKSDGCG